MNLSSPGRWERWGRILCAWLFVLAGITLAIPVISYATDLLLPPAHPWTWREYLNLVRHSFVELAIGFLVLGMPTVIVWAIAWGIRVGRPPRPSFFYLAGALVALLGPTHLLPVALIYFFMGGVMHVLNLVNSAEPLNLPSSAGALLDRLVILFPAFRGYWHGDIKRLSNSADPNDFRDVFAQFSQFFQEHYQRASPEALQELGHLVSTCWGYGVANLRHAATSGFLENLVHAPCLEALKPHLSAGVLIFLHDQCEVPTSTTN